MPQWYAVHVHPNAERAVDCYLRALEIETLYPTFAVRFGEGKRAMEVRRPLFPGYLFVAPSGLAETLAVLRTPHVIRLLGDGKKPLEVPTAEIEQLRLMLNSKAELKSCPLLHTGDQVRVTKGALAGVEGVVCYLKGKANVVVNISMLGRACSTEVGREDLEVINAAAAA